MMSFTIVENKKEHINDILSTRSLEFLHLKTVSERINILGFYFGSINDVEKVIPLKEGLLEYKTDLYLTHKNILLQLRELNITFPVETVLHLAGYIYAIRCSINRYDLINGYFDLEFNPSIVDRGLNELLYTIAPRIVDELEDSYNFVSKEHRFINSVKRVINELDEKCRIEYPISLIEGILRDYHFILESSKECPLFNEHFRRAVISFLVDKLSCEKGYFTPYVGITLRSEEEFNVEYWNKVYNDFFNCAAFYNCHFEIDLPKFSTNLSREYRIDLLKYMKPEHKLNPLFFGLEDINVAGDEELVFYSDGDHDIVETDSLNNLAKVMINSIKSFKDDYAQAETLFTHEHFVGNESATEIWEHILDLISRHSAIILGALTLFLGAFVAWILKKNLSTRADKLVSVIEENEKWEVKATNAFPHDINRRDSIISSNLRSELDTVRDHVRKLGSFDIVHVMLTSNTEFSTKGMMETVLKIVEGIEEVIRHNNDIFTRVEEVVNSTSMNFSSNFNELEKTFTRDDLYKSKFTLAPLFKLCNIKPPIPTSKYATEFLTENLTVTFTKLDRFNRFWFEGTPNPNIHIVSNNVKYIMNPTEQRITVSLGNGVDDLMHKLVNNVNDQGENPTSYKSKMESALKNMENSKKKMIESNIKCKAIIKTKFDAVNDLTKGTHVENSTVPIGTIVSSLIGRDTHIFNLGINNIEHCISLIHGITGAIGNVAALYTKAIELYKTDTKAFEEYFNINTDKAKKEK